MNSPIWTVLLGILTVCLIVFYFLTSGKALRRINHITQRRFRPRIVVVSVCAVLGMLLLVFAASPIQNWLWRTGQFGESPDNRYVRSWCQFDQTANKYLVIVEFGVHQTQTYVATVEIDLGEWVSMRRERWHNLPGDSTFNPQNIIGGSEWYRLDGDILQLPAIGATTNPKQSFYVGLWTDRPLKLEACAWQSGNGKDVSTTDGTLSNSGLRSCAD